MLEGAESLTLSRTTGAVVLTAMAGVQVDRHQEGTRVLANVGAKVQGIVVSSPRPTTRTQGQGRRRPRTVASGSTAATIQASPTTPLPARSIPARLFRSRRKSVPDVSAEEGRSAMRIAPEPPGPSRPVIDLDTVNFDSMFRSNRPAPPPIGRGARRPQRVPSGVDRAEATVVTAEPVLVDRVASMGGGADGILHICTRYLRGGSERRLRDMIRGPPEYDHHVVVGEESDPELAAEQLEATSISVEPSLRREVSPIRDVRAAWRLRRRIRADGSAGRDAPVQGGRRRAYRRRVRRSPDRDPLVVDGQLRAWLPKPASVLFHVAERVLEPFTTGYAVVGEDLLQRYVGIGIPAHKCRVIRSGVPLPAVSPRAEARSNLADRYGVPAGSAADRLRGQPRPAQGRRPAVPFVSEVATLTPRPFLVVAGQGRCGSRWFGN